MIQQVFLIVLKTSIRASAFIVAVLLFRGGIRQRNNCLMCALWGLVAIRLLIPFAIPVPNLKLPDTISHILAEEREPEGGEGRMQSETRKQTVDNPNPSHSNESRGENPAFSVSEKYDNADEKNKKEFRFSLKSVLAGIWAAGVLGMALYHLFSYIHLKTKMKVRVPDGGIVRCDGIQEAFVLGMFRPIIYVPSDIPEECMVHVVTHEKVHIRHMDHIGRIIYTVALSIHWFNPLVWVALFISDRDSEMFCDDVVTKQMNGDEKRLYLMSILSCSRNKLTKRQFLPGFVDGSIKERMSNVMKPKKNYRWLLCVGILSGVFLFMVTMATGEAYLRTESESKEALFQSRNIVCAANYVADIREDGTVRVTQISDGLLELNSDEIAGWKNIVSLYGGMGFLCAVDNNGSMHVSGLEYIRKASVNQAWSGTVSLDSRIQNYSIWDNYLNHAVLMDGSVADPYIFLTKDGELVVLDMENEGTVHVVEKNVAMYEGFYYLRKNGTLGSMYRDEIVGRGYKEKLISEYERLSETGEAFCDLAVTNYGILALRKDGTIATETFGYKKAVSEWKNVKDICGGATDVIVALHTDGTVSAVSYYGRVDESLEAIKDWKDITDIAVSDRFIAGRTNKGEILTIEVWQGLTDRFSGVTIQTTLGE